MFDEEPDGDPHGECAAEIHRLRAEVEWLRDVCEQLDKYWEIRNPRPAALQEPTP